MAVDYLPHKFKFGVTGCQNNCLKAEENDIGIKGGIKVKWIADKCINCGVCESICRTRAVTSEDGKIVLDESKCNYCGRCTKACPADAWENSEGYILSFGGLFGNRIHKGEEIVPIIHDKTTLFRVIDAAVEFFERNANSGERFRLTIERIGEEESGTTPSSLRGFRTFRSLSRRTITTPLTSAKSCWNCPRGRRCTTLWS